MNISIITTPVHDALGITTVAASTAAEARRIAQTDFASFLCSVDLLTVVLYSSDPAIHAKYIGFAMGDYRRDAAEKAKDLQHSLCQVSRLAHAGYFNRQLRLLLQIGQHNSDHGAKLVPVLAYMLEHKDQHCLDASLVDDIQRFLAKRDFVDGYVIVTQTTNTCYIIPSLWGKKVVA